MTGLCSLGPVMIIPRRLVIAHMIAIRVHCSVRHFGRGGATRSGAKHQRQSKQQEAQPFHAIRRLRLIGQRMTSNMVPAIPMHSPPIAKASSHHVLKFSWFFQSMM